MYNLKQGRSSFYSLWQLLQNNHQYGPLDHIILRIYFAIYIKNISSRWLIPIGLSIELGQFGFMFNLLWLLFIIVQGVGYLMYSKEYYLSVQLKIYRYIVVQLSFEYIFKTQERILPDGAHYAIIGIYLVMVCIICFLVKFQNYHKTTLIITNAPFHFYLYLYSLLLHAQPYAQLSYIRLLIFFTLILLVFCSMKSSSHLCLSTFQKIFMKGINMLTLVYAIYETTKIMIQSLFNEFVLFVNLMLVYICLAYYLRNQQRGDNHLIMIDDHLQNGILYVQKWAFDIYQVLHLGKPLMQTQILAFLLSHDRYCKYVSCPLFQQESKQMMTDLHTYKCPNLLLKRSLRHFQLIFKQMYNKEYPKVEDTISYLKFLSIYVCLFQKSKRIIKEISSQTNSYLLSYEIFKLQKEIDLLEAKEESIINIAQGQEYNIFRNTIFNVFESMDNISNLLSQQHINFQSFHRQVQLLSDQTKNVEEYINKHVVNCFTFKNYQILLIYEQYLKYVMNEQDKANDIRKHITFFLDELYNNRQIEFLSTRSQIGLVVISLSQLSLGNIISTNQYAERLFGYEKKELCGSKVNIMMPEPFSTFHDNYLMEFLKKIDKKVNTDERQLVGKHKNGFVFPIFLSLQKMMVSDSQLMFIANIKKIKTKESPLLLLLNPQGKILDFSTGTKFFFCNNIYVSKQFSSTYKEGSFTIQGTERSNYNKVLKYNSILELQPLFFEIAEDNQSNEFELYHQYVQRQVIIFNFKIVTLKFGHELQGYLLIGTKTIQKNDQRAYAFEQLSLKLQNGIYDEKLQSCINTYSARQNTFIMNPNLVQLNLTHIRQKQYTIPYISIERLSSIIDLNVGEINRKYDNGIKMLRLVRHHFEPVQSEMDFESEYDNHNTLINKWQQSLNNDKEVGKNSIRRSWIITLIFSTIIMSLSIAINIFTTASTDERFKHFQDYIQEHNAKTYLSNYIIICKLTELNSQPQYTRLFDEIERRFLNYIDLVKLDQFMKERYFKIIYDKSKISTLASYLPTIYRHEPTLYEKLDVVPIMQFINIAMIVSLSIFLIITINRHKSLLLYIYTYFLYLEQENIDKLSAKINLMKDKLQNRNTIQAQYEIEFVNRDMNKEKQELNKIKSFKNPLNVKIILKYVKVVLIISVVAMLTGLSLWYYDKSLTNIVFVKELEEMMHEVKEESARYIAQSMLSKVYALNNINNNFSTILQNIDNKLMHFENSLNNQTLKDVINVYMSGNICIKYNFLDEKACNSDNIDIVSKGVSRILNYILKTVQSNNFLLKNQDIYGQLFLLQWNILEPVMSKMIRNIQETRIDNRSSLLLFSTLLTAFIIVIIIIQLIILKVIIFDNMLSQINNAIQMPKLYPNQLKPEVKRVKGERKSNMQ